MPDRLRRRGAHSAYSSTSSLSARETSSNLEKYRNHGVRRRVREEAKSRKSDYLSSDDDISSYSSTSEDEYTPSRTSNFKVRDRKLRSRTNLIDSFVERDIQSATQQHHVRQVYKEQSCSKPDAIHRKAGYVLGGHGASQHLAALSRATRSARVEKETKKSISLEDAVSTHSWKLDEAIRGCVTESTNREVAENVEYSWFLLLKLQPLDPSQGVCCFHSTLFEESMTKHNFTSGGVKVVWWGTTSQQNGRILICVHCNSSKEKQILQHRFGNFSDSTCKRAWSPPYWHHGRKYELSVVSCIVDKPNDLDNNLGYVIGSESSYSKQGLLPFGSVASEMANLHIESQGDISDNASNAHPKQVWGENSREKVGNVTGSLNHAHILHRGYTLREVACAELPELLDLSGDNIVPLQRAFESFTTSNDQTLSENRMKNALRTGVQVLESENERFNERFEQGVYDAFELLKRSNDLTAIDISGYLKLCLTVSLLMHE